MPNVTPGIGSCASIRGSRPNPSRNSVYTPASPMAPNSFAPVPPPASPAFSVWAAACPMGYSSCTSSMKCRRSRIDPSSPKAEPDSANASICTSEISSASPSIQAPGTVNARPPATIAPDDMMVCVTLASLSVDVPRLMSLSRNNDKMAANTIGHGSAPILSATYTEDAVMTAHPTHPITTPRRVSCPLIAFIPRIIVMRCDGAFASPTTGATEPTNGNVRQDRAPRAVREMR